MSGAKRREKGRDAFASSHGTKRLRRRRAQDPSQMRWSSNLPRFRLQIDVPRAIPQNSELLRMKSDYEKGGTTGVHVIAFLHPPAVAPVVASVVSKFTLCAHLASSPDWRPKRQCAAPGKAPIEPGTGCTSVVHLSVRLLYGVPGEAMSNIHVNNIQHSKITSTVVFTDRG